jgi:hypothetical protein
MPLLIVHVAVIFRFVYAPGVIPLNVSAQAPVPVIFTGADHVTVNAPTFVCIVKVSAPEPTSMPTGQEYVPATWRHLGVFKGFGITVARPAAWA